VAPTSEGGPERGRRYHHGELRAALIEASFDLLAESGLAAFSVAKVARRLGVSTAAPYRHFPDRDHLMAAVATQAAADLAEHFRQTAERAGEDPAERFAATAGAYVRFVGARGAGFNVIFAAGLERLHDGALADASRRLMDLLLELAQQATGQGPAASLALVEQHVVAAHGYVTLYRDEFFARRYDGIDTIADRAVAESRTLLRGMRTASAAGAGHS
jgi:AcrR family transcriptional regulator